MSDPYRFEIRISLTNDEDREDIVFEDTVDARDEEGLITAPVTDEWRKASRMAVERADDGTDWDVEIECVCITDPDSGGTDWENDMMPQRDEVTEFLVERLGHMSPADG